MEFKTEFRGVGSTKDGRIDGVGTIQGGKYDTLRIDGVVEINGDIEAESLKINGVCTCNGNLTAKVFDCDGVLNVKGNLRAGDANIDGVVTVDGSKVEADRIDCDGVLSVEGEISADFIQADGKLNALEIVGDHITIKSYWRIGVRGIFFKIGGKIGDKFVRNFREKFSVIGLIEGTTVDLRGVHAKSVSGHDVSIGKGCEIDSVSATGTLHIHPKAKVASVL